MEQNITTTNNTPSAAKKQWKTPDFYLLDRNERVNNGVNAGNAEFHNATHFVGSGNGHESGPYHS